jgi:hypothetical protein
MMRARFVERFGEEAAAIVEAAANGHSNGINSENTGSDPFRWALLICIGYECMSVDRYRQYHDFTPAWADVDAWMKEPEQREAFREHDGDSDYLALFSGAYNEYVSAGDGQ